VCALHRRPVQIAEFLAAVLALACVSYHVPANASPKIRYYAAVSDWNAAKAVAREFVSLPSTTDSEARSVLKAMKAGDAVTTGMLQQIQAGTDSDALYNTSSQALLFAASQLRMRTSK